MNGRDLADRLRRTLPDLKVLFMSGYTDNIIAHHGILIPGIAFIQKPFGVKEIFKKIEEVLEQS
ncbi:MAG: hypothetical protein WHS38_07210 [Thermodesulforhabdaceae bacterium]